MEDVQWYDKEELQAAVHMYDSASPDDASADAPMSVAQLQVGWVIAEQNNTHTREGAEQVHSKGNRTALLAHCSPR